MIPGLRRLRQDGHKLEASMGYTVRPYLKREMRGSEGQGMDEEMKKWLRHPRRLSHPCSPSQLLATMDRCHCNWLAIYINGIIYYILFSQGLQPHFFTVENFTQLKNMVLVIFNIVQEH